MNKKQIIERWNELADDYNQYCMLGSDEKFMLFVGADDITDNELRKRIERNVTT